MCMVRKVSLRNYTNGQAAWNAYQHSDDHAPFVPPRPRFQEQQQDPGMPPFGGGGGPPGEDDDDLMGPPGHGPNT